MEIGFSDNFTNKEMTLLYYLVIINIISFIAMGIDKWKAKKERYRISESFLMGLAIIGGAIGDLLGMVVFKHKTNKKKFYIGIPTIYVLTKIIIIAILNYLR